MKQAPGALYIGGGKEGAAKLGFDDAKVSLSELQADGLVMVQAKAPSGANSSTASGFAAREWVLAQVFEYIEVYYNRKCLHSRLRYLSPEVFEARQAA